MKKSFLWLTFLVLLSPNIQADTLKGGYGACMSEELFHELMSAATKKDERAFAYLLKNGCFITTVGTKISILDVGWTGTSKVRAYVSNESIILWTNTENLQIADQ